MSAAEPQPSIDEQWRNEVALRVTSYRRRRGRKEDEHTMRLDFEAPTPSFAQTVIAHVAAERPVDPEVSCDVHFFRRTNVAAAPVYEAEPETFAPEAEFDPDLMVASEHADEFVTSDEPAEVQATTEVGSSEAKQPIAEESAATPEQIALDEARWGFGPEEAAELGENGNVIVFPITPTYQTRTPMYELAEPVLDRPRILDVPEGGALPSVYGPLFANIQLDPEKEENVRSDSRPSIDVPLQVAMINQRVFGGIVDAGVVLAGVAAFAIVFFQMASNFTFTKPAFLAAVAVPAIFWMVYQYVFLTYAGQTPGMMLTHMSLVNFEGGYPDQRRRRQRAISMIVSLMSGGVGFGWALLDPDTLCWHDSISRTYVAQER